MTRESYDRFIEVVKAYQMEAVSDNLRDEEEYLDLILNEIEEENIITRYDSLSELLDDLIEQQYWSDGGALNMMYNDVNEDDEEIDDEFDFCDNDAYRLHKSILDELYNRCND